MENEIDFAAERSICSVMNRSRYGPSKSSYMDRTYGSRDKRCPLRSLATLCSCFVPGGSPLVQGRRVGSSWAEGGSSSRRACPVPSALTPTACTWLLCQRARKISKKWLSMSLF